MTVAPRYSQRWQLDLVVNTDIADFYDINVTDIW